MRAAVVCVCMWVYARARARARVRVRAYLDPNCQIIDIGMLGIDNLKYNVRALHTLLLLQLLCAAKKKRERKVMGKLYY